MPTEEEKPLKGATQKGGGGFLAGILCGTDCCRKDAQPETDMIMPRSSPTPYKKAVDELNVKMPQTSAVQDTQTSAVQDTTEDAFDQAEDVDVEERNVGDKEAETASDSEYPDEYDESEEEESEEEEDPEQEPTDAKAEYKRDHAKSIADLKASFAPIKQNLQENPTPAWKPPEDRGAHGEDYYSDEEGAPPTRPTQKKREIEALKQSYQQQVGGKEGKGQDSERVELKTNVSMRTNAGKKPMPGRSGAARDEEADQGRRRRCCSIQ